MNQEPSAEDLFEGSRNKLCCLPFMNCIVKSKEISFMVISTLSGLIFFGIGIYLEFIILPLNLFMTIGTQQGNYDLFIYIIMAMSAFFNIIYGLVLLTLTQR